MEFPGLPPPISCSLGRSSPHIPRLVLRGSPRLLADVSNRLGGVGFVAATPAEGWSSFTGQESPAEATSRQGARKGVEVADPTAEDHTAIQGPQLVGEAEILVRRSPSATVPWYVHHGAQHTAISTSLDLLVALDLVPHELDELAVASYVSALALVPPGRCTIDGVRPLALGEQLRWSGGVLAVERYWDPRDVSVDHRDAPDALRTALLDVLDRDLDDERPNFLSLSAGTDSSTLAYLAHGLGRELRTLTFAGTTAGAQQQLQDYVVPLWADLGIRHHEVVPFGIVELSRMYDELATPSTVPTLHPVLLSLPALARRWRPSVLVGGEMADEILGGTVIADEMLRHMGPAVPLRLGRQGVGGLRLRSWARAQQRRLKGMPSRTAYVASLPEVFRADLREESHQLYEDRLRRLDRHQRRTSIRWELLTSGVGWVEMNWEICWRHGIRRSIPFLDPRIVELALGTPARELIADGPKTLLRRAVRNDVPARYLDQRKRSDPKVEIDPASIPLPRELDPIVEQLLIPEWRQWAEPSLENRALIRRLNRLVPLMREVTFDSLFPV